MFGELINNITKFKNAVGVELTVLTDGILINAVQLSIKKGVVVVDRKISGASTVSDLRGAVDSGLPVSLSVAGRGILHKKISEPTSEKSKSLTDILPNAKAEDFYLQQYAIDDAAGLYSIVRRQTLHDLLAEFKREGFMIVSVSLGPFAVRKVLPLLNVGARLDIASHHFQIANNRISDYHFENTNNGEDEITIDTEKLESSLLVAYSSALQILSVDDKELVLAVDGIEADRNEAMHRKLFRLTGMALLGFFLVLLMGNFFFYSYYSSQYNALSGNQVRYAEFQNNLENLNRRVEERELFLTKTGWMRPSRISLYADRIGETVPSSITLRELSVNPLNETLTRTEKKLMFTTGKIMISGSCLRPTDLNPWISNIRLIDWVANVEMQNYTYDSKDRKGNFLINIIIK
jgi:hypothetical protein